MPKPKPSKKVDARSEILNSIMRDCEALFPPVESGKRDGFEVVDHPDALKKLWKVAHEFPAIAVGAVNENSRKLWYAKFRNALKVQTAFSKGGAKNNKLRDSINVKMYELEKLN